MDKRPHPRLEGDIAPIIRLDDEVEVAAQLVPRFGYDEAERIMLDAIDESVAVDEEVRRAHPTRAA
jgi:hypothetical protein